MTCCSGDVSHTQLDGRGKWSLNTTGSCHVIVHTQTLLQHEKLEKSHRVHTYSYATSR